MLGERHLARAGRRVFRIVDHVEVNGFIFAEVGDFDFKRIKHRHAARCGGIKLLTDAVVEQVDIAERQSLGNAGTLHKAENGGRREAAAAQTAKRGHTRIIPAIHKLFFNECAKIAFAHDRVGHV